MPLTFLVVLAVALPLAAANLSDAHSHLYAGRFTAAIAEYRAVIAADPTSAAAHEGLVRALLADEQPDEAYKAAETDAKSVTGTAEAHTIAGMVAYRRGQLADAEREYRAALKLNPRHPLALLGITRIHSAMSQFGAATAVGRLAYRLAPDDPMLLHFFANTVADRVEHLALLEKALARVDKDSKLAKRLRPHIAADRAMAGREISQLESPYERTEIAMVRMQAPQEPLRGFGLKVRINGKKTITLLLDTGATGVTLFRGSPAKIGMERLGEETAEIKGIGSEKPAGSQDWPAERLEIGPVVFRNYPVDVLERRPKLSEDGLIGADVFQEFLVTIDHPRSKLILEPHPDGQPLRDQPLDAGPLKPGFFRYARFGHLLAVMTSVNRQPPLLFLVDTGATMNSIDTDTARKTTFVRRDGSIQVAGVQGAVDKVFRATRAELAFAGFAQQNNDLIAIEMDRSSNSVGVELSGLLGMPTLSLLKVTIDYRNGGIRFDRP